MGQGDKIRRAVVSGGTSGIGLRVAERLAADGYALVLLGRDAARGEAAAARVSEAGPHEARFVRLVSEDFAAYAGFIQELGDGPVDALVAAAGIGWQDRLLDTPIEQVERILAVNVAGPIRLVQAVAPRFQSGSAVVLVSSDAAIWGEQATGAYSVSKAALNMAGRMLALDLVDRGVRVNVVCPGDVVPGMRYMLHPGETVRDPEEYRAWPLPPRGRWGDAADVAALVAFLVSPAADFMVGSVIRVDGGSRTGVPDGRDALSDGRGPRARHGTESRS